MTTDIESIAQPPMNDVHPSDDVEVSLAPPVEPFEEAGFLVRSAVWENEPVRWSRFPFPYSDASSPRLQAFLDRYDFARVIDGVEDEFQQLVMVRDWVHHAIPSGMPVVSASDPFEILDEAAAGGTFFCSHYAIVLQSCLTALGWTARHVGIDSDHGPDESSTHHGVVDVYVNSLRKWVALDAHHEVHYEKEGVPLSPWEISCEYAATEGESVEVRVGTEMKRVEKSTQISLSYRNEACSYFWGYHYWGVDPLAETGHWTLAPRLKPVLVGPAHEGKVWYQGAPPKTHPHNGYSDGSFQFTRRTADSYPGIGTCHLVLSELTHGQAVRVSAETFTPNLETILGSIDKGPFRPVGTSFDWYPHQGDNVLAVKTRNRFGKTGPVSLVSVTLEKADG